ncbi:Mgm101p-domain-containing protein [Durotheca rogersii]|uniref:Mgm101p-domain-containing protein n=1 Tax=Durotheca rogersii TaxID=419775 RepID=UPI00221F2C4B|nr:Mgm101p-domain-containing protein [Durotheca rogersii]KAI5861444.1 Mgm101p-domain-containing protein [Durotheca rogersii]
MASRSLTPLRVTARAFEKAFASPQMVNWARRIPASRTVVSKSTLISSTSSSRAASTTATTPKSESPSSEAAPAAADAKHKRVPAVSGIPLPDAPPTPDPITEGVIDWSRSYHGLGTSTFGPEVAAVLQAPLNPDDIEVKPDGIIYLPEIKYRRILNAAFGPGGWGLAPRADLQVNDRTVTREYALIVHGRFVGQARGEQQFFTEEGIATASEGCKSNALMRCCKDLGIASELWDPRFIRKFMREHAMQVWAEHVTTKKRKQIWLRKDEEIRYPFKKA